MTRTTLFAILVGLPVFFAGCKKPAPPPTPVATKTDTGGSLADRLKAVETGEGSTHAALPDLKQFAENTSTPSISLQPGLEISIVDPERAKDHPSEAPLSSLIVSVSASQILVHHRNNPQADKERHFGQLGHEDGATQQVQAEVDHREPECDITVDRADLSATHNLRNYVCQSRQEHFPDTEPLGLSTDVLTQLRAGRQVEFHFIPDSEATASLVGLTQGSGRSDLPPLTQHANLKMFSCTLHRVEGYDLAYPVEVDGQPTQLPALHAMCTFPDKTEGHLYVLDQPENPLLLWSNMGVLPETLQVIRIKRS